MVTSFATAGLMRFKETCCFLELLTLVSEQTDSLSYLQNALYTFSRSEWQL